LPDRHDQEAAVPSAIIIRSLAKSYWLEKRFGHTRLERRKNGDIGLRPHFSSTLTRDRMLFGGYLPIVTAWRPRDYSRLPKKHQPIRNP